MAIQVGDKIRVKAKIEKNQKLNVAYYKKDSSDPFYDKMITGLFVFIRRGEDCLVELDSTSFESMEIDNIQPDDNVKSLFPSFDIKKFYIITNVKNLIPMPSFNVGDKVFYISSMKIKATVSFDSENDSGLFLLEIDPEGKGRIGWLATLEDKNSYGCVEGKRYIWSSPGLLTLRNQQETTILSCRQCSYTDKYYQSNCNDGGFLCFSCTGTYRWKYTELLIT